MRKCQNLQWMPSKIFLQKQGKGKKDKKKNKLSDKKEGLSVVKGPNSESGPKPAPAPPKEEPLRKKSETPPLKPVEEKSRQQPSSKQSSPALTSSPAPVEAPQVPSTIQTQSPALTPDLKQLTVTSSASGKKGHKSVPASSSSSTSSCTSSSSSSSSSSSTSSAQNSPCQSTQSHQASQQQQRPPNSQTPSKKDASPKIPLSEAKKKLQEQSPQQQSSATVVSDTGTNVKLKYLCESTYILVQLLSYVSCHSFFS